MNNTRFLLPLLLTIMFFATDVSARSTTNDWRWHWRNDDGNLESATWAADENSQATLVGHHDHIRLRTHMTGTCEADALEVKPGDSETARNYSVFFDYADSEYLTGAEPTEKLLNTPSDIETLIEEKKLTFNEDGACVVMKSSNRTITVPGQQYQEIELCLKALENTPEGTYTFLLPNINKEAILRYMPARYADIATLEVTDIKGTTATGHGDLTDPGLRSPVQHGVCWSVSEAPTTADNKTEEGAASETGAFSTPITGLEENTTYYLRAYATNSAGTVYGEQVDFTTGDAKESYGPGGCFVKALLP